MAKSLLDALRKGPTEQAQMSDTGAALQRLVRAKSGKAVGGGSGAVASSIGEQAAVQQTQQGLGDLANKMDVQASGMEVAEQAQQDQYKQQRSQQEQQRVEIENAAARESQSLIDELRSNEKQLDTEKYIAKQEQLGFQLAMQDREYLHNLEQEGAKLNLTNELVFQEQLQQDIYGATIDLLKDRFDWEKLNNADEREFAEMMAEMSIDDAIAISNAQMEQANAQAKYGGIGSMISGGTQVATAYADGKFKNKNSNTGTSTNPNAGLKTGPAKPGTSSEISH